MSEDNDHKLSQNSIQYLHSLSTAEELNNPILKSFYSMKLRLMELRKRIFLPTNISKQNIKCPRCLLNWLEGPANYRIKSKPKKHKFGKKIMSKMEHDLKLTNFQQNYLQKMNKCPGNYLVITCKFCKKNTNIKLEMPEIIKKPQTVNPTKQKKKKKKKDRFCGLNQDIVQSLTPKNIENESDSEKVSLDSYTTNTPKLKLSKRDISQEVVVVEEKVNESLKKRKKKKKTLDKLSEALNSSTKSLSPSANLKLFLKGL